MKCKWNQCKNEARAKSPFCSGTCKKRYARSETDVPVEVGQEQVGQPSGTRPPSPVKTVATKRGRCANLLNIFCHFCDSFRTCDYLHNMNSAVPGDAEYAGVI